MLSKAQEAKLHSVWRGMKDRCYREKCASFKDYGGRGIAVCDAWRDDFLAFKTWAVTAGYGPGLTIERVNNDGHYQPDNCRWASQKEQNRNQRQSIYVEHNGARLLLVDLSEQSGVSYHVLRYRILSLRWSVEKAVKTPIDQTRRRKLAIRFVREVNGAFEEISPSDRRSTPLRAAEISANPDRVG